MFFMDNTVTEDVRKNFGETMILFVFQKLTRTMMIVYLTLIDSGLVMATIKSTSKMAGNMAMVMAEEEMTPSISQIFSTASIILEVTGTTILLPKKKILRMTTQNAVDILCSMGVRETTKLKAVTDCMVLQFMVVMETTRLS